MPFVTSAAQMRRKPQLVALRPVLSLAIRHSRAGLRAPTVEVSGPPTAAGGDGEQGANQDQQATPCGDAFGLGAGEGERAGVT